MRGRDDFRDGQCSAEGIGDVRHGHQPGARPQQFQEGGQVKLALGRERRGDEARARRGADQLPGYDVGVMLEVRDQDLIAGAQLYPAPGARNQVDRFGRTAGKDDLACLARIDEAAHGFARCLESDGGLLAQRVDAAMHIGVAARGVVLGGLEDGPRLLRGGCAVEVDERPAVYLAAQNRKIGAYPLGAQQALGVEVAVCAGGRWRAHWSSSVAGISASRAAAARPASRLKGGRSMALRASARNAHFRSERASPGDRPRDSR